MVLDDRRSEPAHVSTLFLITARGGSKGVPGKNLRRIGGKSLIEWKVNAARPAMRDGDRMVLSTENQEIAGEGARLGVSILSRPQELATDTASSASVITHALGEVPGYDQVLLLEPSAPFTTATQYGIALAMIGLHDADLVIGMRLSEPHTTFIGSIPENNSIGEITMKMRRESTRRQDFEPQWTPSGGLYLFRTDMFLKTGSIYGGKGVGLLQNRWQGLEIDTMDDLAMAEFAVERGLV